MVCRVPVRCYVIGVKALKAAHKALKWTDPHFEFNLRTAANAARRLAAECLPDKERAEGFKHAIDYIEEAVMAEYKQGSTRLMRFRLLDLRHKVMTMLDEIAECEPEW